MNMLTNVRKYGKYLPLLGIVWIASCSDDDAPEEENVVEVFTDVTLIFTNTADNSTVTATATDPDGVGSQPLVVQGGITLTSGATYMLTYEIENALDPNDVEDIGAEILEEDNEHQFFYSFTEGAFSSPTGDGNIDTASDPINYEDMDENGWNVGLVTSWTAGDPLTGGEFRTNLQHQPDAKTATSGSDAGDTDFDLTFDLTIE
ncbi:MAG: GTP cyclohydrolase [Bacteroidota bacterium]